MRDNAVTGVHTPAPRRGKRSEQMTTRAFEAQATWRPTVVGLPCSAVRTDGEALLSLYFGALSGDSEDDPDAERIISLGGAWRIELGDHVLAGANDPDDERQESIEELIGHAL